MVTEPRKRRVAWRWPSVALHTRRFVWAPVRAEARPICVPSRESTMSKTGMPWRRGVRCPALVTRKTRKWPSPFTSLVPTT